MVRSRTERWARLLAIGLAIAVPGPTVLWVLLQNGVNIPFYDEWYWGTLLAEMHNGTLSFNNLWLPHNEHRIFFPTLIALGAAKLFGWNVIFESVLGLALLTLSQFSLFRMTRDTLGPNWGALALVLTSFVLFSLGQGENIMWGFQIAWFLVIFCVITTIDVLRSKTRNVPRVLVAGSLCFVSSFSSAFGLFVPLIAASFIVARDGVRSRSSGLWVLYSLGLVVAYVSNLHMDTGSPSHMHLGRAPLELLVYVLAYLGSPVAGWSGSQACCWIGAGGLVWFGACTIVFARGARDPEQRSRWLPWFALSCFGLGAAAMTAYGRVGLGIDEALSSRYTTLGAQFWIALVPMTILVLLTVGRSASVSISRGFSVAVFACFAMLVYGIARQNVNGYAFAGGTIAARYAALIALQIDPEKASDTVLLPIYPNAGDVRSNVEELRKDGLWPLR